MITIGIIWAICCIIMTVIGIQLHIPWRYILVTYIVAPFDVLLIIIELILELIDRKRGM